MSALSQLFAAVSVELSDVSRRLMALQDVPLLQSETGQPLSGDELLRAMIALQDLDGLAQTSAALAALMTNLAAADPTDRSAIASVEAAMHGLHLQSVADRLRERIAAAA